MYSLFGTPRSGAPDGNRDCQTRPRSVTLPRGASNASIHIVSRTPPSGELFHTAAILRSLFAPMEPTAPDRWGREVARALGIAASATRVVLVVGRGPSTQV